MEVVSTNISNIKIEGYRGDYIFETIQKTGDYYESSILNRWSPIIGTPNVIFDVGSNIGNHAIYWAIHLRPLAIYAFEPYPDNFFRLKNNIINNSLNNIIMPIQKGVGDHLGYASISNIDETNLGSTSFVYTTDKQESAIQITDLDSFSKDNQISTVDFIKIDTEGFELLVLKGMRELIKKCHPDIWVEVSYTTYSEVIDFLQAEGYILHDIDQFNLLFLHPTRHSMIAKVDNNKVLDGFFKYLEKTNHYYKAYNTSKKWLEDRNKAFEQLKIKYQKQIQDNKNDHNKSFEASRDQYDKKLMETLEEVNRELRKEKIVKDKLLGALKDDVDLFDDIIDELNNIKQFVRKLQIQNSYLSAENQEYRRKIEKITGTWYGKILIKLYKFLQRVKKKLNW